MKLIKNICIFVISLSMIVIPNNYSGVISEVYGDATEIYGLGDDESTLVWSDEFNGNSLDTTKWNNEGATGFGGYGNKELQDYEMDYCEVNDGKLIIKPQFQYNSESGKLVTDSFYSTKLWTKNQFNFKYGRIEIRAKLPKGQGTNALGWMLGTGSSGSWPDCGEIDLFETTNESSKTLIPQSIHCKKFNGMYSSSGNKHWDTTVSTATSEYHTYGAIWNNKRITFTVDGVPSGTFDPSQYTLSGDGTDDNTIWPFNNSAYLILNCAIGGTLGGTVTTDGWTKIATNQDKYGDTIETYQDKMYVDYVRVFKTKQSVSEEETTTEASSNTPETENSWDSYFGVNEGWYEGAEGSLTDVSDNGFTAKMTTVGWGGVWGCQVRKPVKIVKGQEYAVVFNMLSSKVNKYVYVKISESDNLAKGFWVYLPKGQTVEVEQEFTAENNANQLTFGLGGEAGDREGADLDAAERYAIFDEQFGTGAYKKLSEQDSNGDFASVTDISVSNFLLTDVIKPVSINDYECTSTGNTIMIDWSKAKPLHPQNQVYNIYLDGKRIKNNIQGDNTTINDVTSGFHQVGVSAEYKGLESGIMTKQVIVKNESDYKIVVSGNQIAIEWKQTEEQSNLGQKYIVYLDTNLVGNNIKGNKFILKGLTSGLHLIDIKATLDGKESEMLSKFVGINSIDNTKKADSKMSNDGIKNKVIIAKIVAKKKSLNLSWKKVSGVNGYQVQYSTKKNFKKSKTITIKNSSVTSKKIKKLKRKKKYFVRVRAYKLVNGRPKYSAWSKKKAKKTK